MPKVIITVQDGESFIGVIQLEKLDENEEPITRKIARGASLSALLEKASHGKLTLGKIEVNLDFDDKGELVQIEIYS